MKKKILKKKKKKKKEKERKIKTSISQNTGMWMGYFANYMKKALWCQDLSYKIPFDVKVHGTKFCYGSKIFCCLCVCWMFEKSLKLC